MTAYATLEQADAYFNDLINNDPWIDCEPRERQQALNEATKRLDAIGYLGTKLEATQVNQFPRKGETAVPDEVIEACIIFANALLDGIDPEIEFENLGLTSQGIGSVRTAHNANSFPEHIRAGIPHVGAYRLIKPYILDPQTVRVDRSS